MGLANPHKYKGGTFLLGLGPYYQRFIPKFAQMACCLNELVGPTSNKTKKIRHQKKKKTIAQKNQSEGRVFNWMQDHQKAFDVLKEALVTALVLGYLVFNREFVLETNASLQGLGAMLSQQDETGKLCMIAYAS